MAAYLGKWLLTLILTLPDGQELDITNVYLTAEDCASAGLFFILEEDSPYHTFTCSHAAPSEQEE